MHDLKAGIEEELGRAHHQADIGGVAIAARQRLQGACTPAASLLDRCSATRTCPKVIEAFGSTELWRLRMSPGLIGTDAKTDIPLPDTVRGYYYPGTTHGGGRGGFRIEAAPSAYGLGRRRSGGKVERETGFEPATFCLGSRHSAS